MPARLPENIRNVSHAFDYSEETGRRCSCTENCIRTHSGGPWRNSAPAFPQTKTGGVPVSGPSGSSPIAVCAEADNHIIFLHILSKPHKVNIIMCVVGCLYSEEGINRKPDLPLF